MTRSSRSVLVIAIAMSIVAVGVWLFVPDRFLPWRYSHEVTLSWSAPVQHRDGTRMDDLAGFYIYYGTGVDNLTQSIHVDNPAVTNYTVGDLDSGTYYFAVTAVNASGYESDWSDVMEKKIP